MSGDVQPRKRKEKRRKKDDLGVEEPRGTAAIFGEGDVLMHSHHEHGTGGHWCAKIIFFSLLAVLVTLIGLIILENRGLSELEANAVESRYSGVLEGWIEDAPDDDHHDEHTLELKHHRYEDNHEDGDDDHEPGEPEHDDEDDQEENNINEDDEHDDEKEHENDEELQDDEEHEDDDDDEELQDDEEHEDDDDEELDNDEEYEDDDGDIDHEDKDTTENVLEIDDQDDEDAGDGQNVEEDNEDDETMEYNKYYKYNEHDEEVEYDENLESKDSQEEEIESKENDEGYDDNESNEIIEDNDDNIISYEENNENDYNENSEQNEDEDEFEEEIERIEKEFVDEVEEAISGEESNIKNELNNKKKATVKDIQDTQEIENEEEENTSESGEVIESPIVEQITAPSGKPFIELEDEKSTEKPSDTLAEEEEYEKRQEQIRLEKEESSSQMWLKLTVGGALLVATHAVIRRFTAPRDAPEAEDNPTRDDDPTLIDRRMTLIPRESAPLLAQESFGPTQVEPDETVVKHLKTFHSDIIHKQEDEQIGKKEELVRKLEVTSPRKDILDQELYSDDDEEVDEDDEVEREAKEYSKDTETKVEKDADESETEEVPDDVEIIDDEQIDEEIEDEDEDEEEISDVDDAELLSRLEAKYGRLPEPERPGYKHKDGGNNIEDEWPGEPSEQFRRQQLDFAEQEIRQGEWAAASARLSGGELAGSARALWLAARAIDAEAEQRRDNKLLTRAISSYLQLLKMNEQLSDKKLLQITNRLLDRIRFRGNYLSAEPVYRILIRRFPDDVSYRNNLTVSFLMANRADLAGDVLKETLKLWPNDQVALAHYGFVLKTQYNKLEESVEFFRKALENDTGAACEPRFYYHLGDALLLLGRFDEAHEVHERGAKNGHFLSPAQRSLYNVNRLRSRPWWRIEDTPYVKLARALEKSWKDILKEGEAARALYEKENEGLKEKGEWSQLDIFVRGQEIPGRCKRAAVTCSIVKSELAAAYCRRGQIKFSSMEPGTHVRPHVGPTNCRLRMHLGLSNTKDTYIRVDKETRQWQLGKVLVFDDSFEHEVWHNGTGTRLVLIVDVWHPDLTLAERRQLPAI